MEYVYNFVRRAITRVALLTIAALVLCRLGSAQQSPPVTLVVTGGTLIDGTGATSRPNVTILVSGDRITRVGPGTTPVPANARTIRADGKFIIPGLIDSHVHYRDYYPELLITHGITSVVDWGGSPVEWILAQKDGVAKGKIYGPRIFTSGEVIGEEGGKEDATPEAALQHLRRLVSLGVDRVDLGFEPRSEVMKAVIEESHRLGLSVSGYPLRAREAIEDGIDALKHTHTLGRAYQTQEAPLQLLARQTILPERRRDSHPCLLGDHYDDLLRLMIAHKTIWIPTLVKDFKAVLDRRDEFEKENVALLGNPELQYLPVQDMLPQITNSSDEGLMSTPCGLIGTYDRSNPDYELYQRTYKNLKQFIRKFAQSGGRVLAGTAPHSFVLPGISLHHEMLLFVDAGLTPMQALQSATLWGAEYVHAQKDIGSVEEGKLADIVILGKNPLEDIRNTRSVETVIQGGRLLPTGYHHSYSNPIPRNTLRNAPSGGYPRPELQRISPLVITEDSGDLAVKVSGRQFNPKSVVQFDKVSVPTEFVSETELRAVIPASLLRNAGTYWLVVWNPRPGGGDSSPASLIVKFK